MSEIQAFRGIRYDLGHVGSLGDVIAPPYDVIGPELQTELYKRHPANCIRLILNRREPGDDEVENCYSRAARFLKNWRSEGVLYTEPDPAIYVYHQQFTYAGQSINRRSFMARVRLQRFGEGNIYPHEETMSGPKKDRLLLQQACQTQLSPIFGLFPDDDNQVQNVLEQAVAKADQPAVEATDHLGVVHRVWTVTDLRAIGAAAALFSPRPIFIADGHHRYETACNFRDALAAAGPLDHGHPANFVMMVCVGMRDPGLCVLPTHRLFAGLPPLNSADLISKLGRCFTTRLAGEGADLAESVWQQIEQIDDQGTLALFCAADQRWVLATITGAGRARLAEVAASQSDDWRQLGVSILHRLVIDTLLDARDLARPKYVRLVEEVVEGLDSGDYPLAALVMPATVEDIRRVSEHGERMPAKSTYFYPKMLSGLVFNPLT